MGPALRERPVNTVRTIAAAPARPTGVSRARTSRLSHGFLVLIVLAGAGACAGRESSIPPDPAMADRFLMERGREAMEKRRWADAREYFRQIVDNYPGSSFRADAKLGVGDAYLQEGSAESLVLGANEFREFLTFYPTHPRADYAQYQLAMTFFEQMRAPDRDPTPTREALAEFQRFFDRFPQSPLTGEVKEKWRIARDRLSEHTYRVGLHYFRQRWCPAANSRFREVLQDDPAFSRIDGVYYHLAECLARADNKAEAIPLFARVVGDYMSSEFFEDAQKRLIELKAQ
jgi:outer membrane protein assembly factor BamD